MRNYLDKKTDGVSSSFKMTDNHRTFNYTLLLTFAVSAVMAFVEYLILEDKTCREVFLIIYRTFLPTIITYLATIILRNLVAERKDKYLHGNIVGLIAILMVPVLYVATLLINHIALLIMTGVLGVVAVIVSIWSYYECPTE